MHTELNKLEAKYWAGNTTLEEEATLRKAALRSDASLSRGLIAALCNMEEAGTATLPQSFDQDFWTIAEAPQKNGGLVVNLAMLMRYAAAAAVLAVVAITAFYLLKSSPEPVPTQVVLMNPYEDTFSDPDEALAAAMQALGMAGEKLNKGKQPVKEIKRFHQTKAAIAGMGQNTVKHDSTSKKEHP